MQFWLKDKGKDAVSLYTESEEGIKDSECTQRICELVDKDKKVIVMDVAAYFESLPSKEEFFQRELFLKKGEKKVACYSLVNGG